MTRIGKFSILNLTNDGGVDIVELTEWLNAISNVGFPIVTTVVVMWFVKYMTDKYDSRIDDLTSVVQENTAVIMELLREIKRGKEGE